MSQQKAGVSRDRLMTLILILAVAVASVAFGYWIGMFSLGRVEKIYFDSCEWADDACILSIANTGADELIINKVWINGTQVDSTDWECFPSMRFQPGDQGALCITASLAIFQQGTTYQFILQTLAGNSFSHTAKPQGSQFTFMGYEKIEITTVTWNWDDTAANRTIAIVISNTGTKDVTVHHVEVNYVGIASDKVSPSPSFPFKTTDPDKPLTITYAYTNGTAYDVSIVTSGGYEFTDHFTGGQNVG